MTQQVLADKVWDRSGSPLVLRMRPAIEMNDEQFFAFCQQNQDLRIERTAEGDWIVMPPTGWEAGARSAEMLRQLANWARQDGTGVAADSSTGYHLPNGADRSPDASWLLTSRLAATTPQQRQTFLPLCPDFVAEVRSPSDSVTALKDKMQEYLDNGARLGLLIDPPNRRVYVYRPNTPAAPLDDPATVACDPELPGFVLDVQAIFNTGF